jgi:hypothetical protein
MKALHLRFRMYLVLIMVDNEREIKTYFNNISVEPICDSFWDSTHVF